MSDYTADPLSGGRMRMARSRGLASGMLLLILGAWAAIVPFIGDYMNFAYTPTSTWTWTAGRGWYEVAPGAAALLGGLLLLLSANRAVTSLGAWLGIAGGAWLIIGPQLATFVDVGSTGTPTATSTGVIALERLAYFYAVGAAILLVAAVALGRLSVRSVGDVRAARRREAAAAESMAAEGVASQAVGPAAPAPATTAAQSAAMPESAARGDTDAHRQRRSPFQLMRRHWGQQTDPTTQPRETPTQNH
ncbi:MAG: hypothetical protein ACRDQH_09360 [Pseudonocardiaceae bacterium]